MMAHTAMQLNIGINPLYPGEKLQDGDRRWGEHTASFQKESHTIESLARRITQDGCAFSAVMQDNYRKTANFLSAQHIGLDDDRGTQDSSLDALAADPFIGPKLDEMTHSQRDEKNELRIKKYCSGY